MNWNIKDSGDPFEKKCYNLITNKLKNYNVFWSSYVGNINGKPADIKGISSELNDSRLLIAQWNYTFLRNVYMTSIISERNKSKKIRSVIDSLNQEVDFLLATHLLYNSIELAKKVNLKIEIKSSLNNYTSFVEFRNFLTHNIKPLVKISDGFFHVPSNFEWFENSNIPTNDSWIWSETDFSRLKFQRISTYFEWCFENSISLFNQILSDEIVYFNKKLKNMKIVDFEPTPIKQGRNNKPSSGTTTVNQ